MKIGNDYDLSIPANKAFINEVIEKYGYAKRVNQCALTVLCRDDIGREYEIVQFHRNRDTAHIVAGVLLRCNER